MQAVIGRQGAATALTTALLGFLMLQGLSASPALILVAAAVFCYVVVACGLAIQRVFGGNDLPLAAAWPLGVIPTGVALWALVTLLHITAAAAFAIWAAFVISFDLMTRRRAAQEAPTRIDLVGLALCCAFTAAWCKDIAAGPVTLAEHGYLPAWADYFIHGGIISQFGDVRTIDRGAILLADVPKHFYHYASYLLPAVFAAPLDQPGLPLATSLWLPIGFLSLAAAAYALGASLAGPAGGVAALAALFVIPDASNYWMQNGFFSFHWCLLAIPGSDYSLASSLLAVVFLHRWIERKSLAALFLSGALLAATLLLRVHVFLLLAPSWLVTVAIASPHVRRNWMAYFIGAALAGIAAASAYRFLPNLAAEGLLALDRGRALEGFLRAMHTMQAPTAYLDLYPRILARYGDTVGFAFGILLVYPAAIGAFLVLFPVALLLERSALRPGGIDAFPLALFPLYAVHMLLAPTPSHNDPSDLVHRPFVLVYAAIAIWTLAYFVRWVSRRGPDGSIWLPRTLAAGAALALPILWTQASEMARPKFHWGRDLAKPKVAPEMLAAAAYLRTHAQRGDTFATWELTARAVATDAATELSGMTAVPAYIARYWIHNVLGGETAKTALARYIALIEVTRLPDAESALRRLRELGVRWYVVTYTDAPTWDPKRIRAVQTFGDSVAIYDTGAPPRLRPGTP